MSRAAKYMLMPVLVAQAMRTRARLPRLPEAGGERHGCVGTGERLRLLVAGDSSAAGVGVVTQRKALAAPLAQRLAERCGACVDWRVVARSGLNTAQTLRLLQRETLPNFDLAVVATGVNDIIDQVPEHQALSAREAIVHWLQQALGVWHVVFAPLPPVHQFPGLPQPLRWWAGSEARRHDRAMARWAAARAGVSRVEMNLRLAPEVMASDGFHPGEPVYRQCAEAIAEHIATSVWPRRPIQETSP